MTPNPPPSPEKAHLDEIINQRIDHMKFTQGLHTIPPSPPSPSDICVYCKKDMARICWMCASKNVDSLTALNAELRAGLDKVACSIADMTSSKDFDCGNVRTYLENTYKDINALLRKTKPH